MSLLLSRFSLLEWGIIRQVVSSDSVDDSFFVTLLCIWGATPDMSFFRSCKLFFSFIRSFYFHDSFYDEFWNFIRNLKCSARISIRIWLQLYFMDSRPVQFTSKEPMTPLQKEMVIGFLFEIEHFHPSLVVSFFLEFEI